MKGGRGEYLVPVTIPSTYVIFPKIWSSKHSFFFSVLQIWKRRQRGLFVTTPRVSSQLEAELVLGPLSNTSAVSPSSWGKGSCRLHAFLLDRAPALGTAQVRSGVVSISLGSPSGPVWSFSGNTYGKNKGPGADVRWEWGQWNSREGAR